MSHNRTPVPDQAIGDIVIVLVRLPVPGEVKNRLAKSIGPNAAAELYRALAEWTFAHTASPATAVWRRWAAFSPRTAMRALQTWLKPYGVDHVLPQAPGDLGTRLMASTAAAFHARAGKVVIIGTDCPAVDQRVIADAFAALDHSDVVLGPANDGGYYLLGLRESAPKLFSKIPWNSVDVLDATKARAAELGLSVHELAAESDIDEVEDLAKLPDVFLDAHPQFAELRETANRG